MALLKTLKGRQPSPRSRRKHYAIPMIGCAALIVIAGCTKSIAGNGSLSLDSAPSSSPTSPAFPTGAPTITPRPIPSTSSAPTSTSKTIDGQKLCNAITDAELQTLSKLKAVRLPDPNKCSIQFGEPFDGPMVVVEVAENVSLDQNLLSRGLPGGVAILGHPVRVEDSPFGPSLYVALAKNATDKAGVLQISIPLADSSKELTDLARHTAEKILPDIAS